MKNPSETAVAQKNGAASTVNQSPSGIRRPTTWPIPSLHTQQQKPKPVARHQPSEKQPITRRSIASLTLTMWKTVCDLWNQLIK